MKFTVKNCAVYIHPLFLCLICASLLLGQATTLFPALLFLWLHESGHLCCAALFHIPVQMFTLGPFGGTMHCDMQHLSRTKRICLSLSGPLANLIGYAICYTFLCHANAHVAFWLDGLRCNLLLLLINLLPVLPLDGGQCLLSAFNNAPLCRRLLAHAGHIFAFSLILLSLVFAWHGHLLPAPALAGCFLLYYTSIEKRSLSARCMHSVLSGDIRLRKHRLLPLHGYAAIADMTLLDASIQLPLSQHSFILVLSETDFSPIGTLFPHAFCDALLSDSHMTLKQALTLKH